MNDFEEFFETQGRFQTLTVIEQICRVVWFLHRFRKRDRITPRDVADMFRSIHISPPQTSVYMPRLAKRKPAMLLCDKGGYFLEGRERKRLDDLLAPSATTAAVSNLLNSLVDQIHDGPERVFLDEAIRCYRVTAFRAAIVMTWNLAYDHLRRWIISDPERLASFNAGSSKRFTKNPKIQIGRLEDFDDYKESELIDACYTGKDNIKKFRNNATRKTETTEYGRASLSYCHSSASSRRRDNRPRPERSH